MKARKWILLKHFDGIPKDSDLEMVEEELPELKEGEVLFEALFISVDPYMRIDSKDLEIGSVMLGQQLARVVASRCDRCAEGQLFLVCAGWRDRVVINPDEIDPLLGGRKVVRAVNTGPHPSSITLGVLGMPGLVAYLGLLRICEPKSGETVFINSAAGIVGNVAGQIAKIKGCRVIGCAGTDEKCRWLTSELGFDYAFNYKSRDLSEALKEGAPQGIDCYFDNVGGDMSTTVIRSHMNRFGRVCCCGFVSQYNDIEPATGPYIYDSIVYKELTVKGFYFPSWRSNFQSAIEDLQQWVFEGKIKYREDIVNGFENMRMAFYGMLSGKYSGKVVVKII